MSKPRGQSGFKFALAGFLGGLFVRSLHLTWRVRETPKRFVFRYLETKSGGPGRIFVHWHSRILLAVGTQKGCGTHVLISEHGDGEYIARTAHQLGYETVRGSSSRGGARALIDLVKLLRSGEDVAFTPDGPKGPRFRVQAGCIVAAMKSGAEIVPIAFDCSSAKRLRSWDRFVVPKPFARVSVRFGEPYTLPRRMSEEEIEEARLDLERRLVELHALSAAEVGIEPETPETDPLGATSGSEAV